jgi:hypothetical protein
VNPGIVRVLVSLSEIGSIGSGLLASLADVGIEYPMSCSNVGCDVLGRYAIPEELYDFVFVRLEVNSGSRLS